MLFQRSIHRFIFHFLTLLIVMGSFLSCAGTKAGPSDEGPAGEIRTAIAEPVKEDKRLQAYRDVAFAALYEGEGEYEKAREYLARAIENDPESAY